MNAAASSGPASAAAPSADSLERVRQRALASSPGWLHYLSWGVAALLLAWAWRGAEIRPLDLLRDSGNIGTYTPAPRS